MSIKSNNSSTNVFKWDLSDFYTSISDKKYQEDFLKLVESIFIFKKKYDKKIQTFHTYEDFCLFYGDYEKFLRLFYKIQYFIFLKKILNTNDVNLYEEESKLTKMQDDLVNFCSDRFALISSDGARQMLDLLQYKKWSKYYHLIKEELFSLSSWKIDITELRNNKNKKSKILHDLQSQNLNIDQKIDIYIQLVESNIIEAKLHNYAQVEDYFLCNYGVSVKLIKTFIESISKFVSPSFYYNYWKYEKYENIEYKDIYNILWDVLKKIKLKDIDIFAQIFLTKKRIHIYSWWNEYAKDLSVQVPYSWSFIYWNFFQNKKDFLSLFHELGHCYQFFIAQKQDIFSQSASVFLSEVSALYWENLAAKILDIKRDVQYNICSYYVITRIELFVYELWQEKLLNADKIKQYIWENFWEEWIERFFSAFHVFHSPFYISSYIFAEIISYYFVSQEKIEDYKYICSIWKNMDIFDIFSGININIFDKHFYDSVLNSIFS